MAVKNYSDVVAKVKARQQELKQASAAGTETDPADKGTKTIPVDPNATTAAQNMPANRENTTAPSSVVTTDLKPAPTGQEVPATTPGDPKDKSVTAPTDPLSKIATQTSAIVANILAMQKGAGAAPVAAAPVAPAAARTEAVAGDIQLSPEFHFKLASEILATEEGIAFAERLLTKRAGEVAANELIKNACHQQAAFAQIDAQQAAADQQLAVVGDLIKGASAEDQTFISKFASAHALNLSAIADPIEKMAYMQGAGDAAAMTDAEAGGGKPEIPGASGPASLEELAQLLDSMVQAKEIDEQTAQQVFQELAQAEQGGAGGGEAPGGAAPAPDAAPAPAEGTPSHEAGETPAKEEAEEKAASALIRELVPAFAV